MSGHDHNDDSSPEWTICPAAASARALARTPSGAPSPTSTHRRQLTFRAAHSGCACVTLVFRESTGEIETIKVSESLHVDLSPDGKVYGVELLDANRQLDGEGFLTFVNEASGSRNVVPTG